MLKLHSNAHTYTRGEASLLIRQACAEYLEEWGMFDDTDQHFTPFRLGLAHELGHDLDKTALFEVVERLGELEQIDNGDHEHLVENRNATVSNRLELTMFVTVKLEDALNDILDDADIRPVGHRILIMPERTTAA